jgi:MATE family multidrug resistance protein
VRRIAFAAYGLNLIAAVVLAGGIFVGREALCYCFTTSSEVVMVTLSLMIPFLFYQLGDSMQVVFANSLRAIEDVKPLVWYAFIAYILVSIPVSYLFAFVLKMGPQGVWWGFPFGLTTAGLLFFQRFYRKTKSVN